MLRPIIAIFLSVVLSLPATTASAQGPNGRDVAKILGGLVALYALKEAIDHRRDRKRDRRQAMRQQIEPDARPHDRRDHRAGSDRRRAQNRLRAPDRCIRRHVTDRGRITGYGARCMQNRVARPGLLPPRCIRRLDTDRGRRAIYAPRCLRREGWRTARN